MAYFEEKVACFGENVACFGENVVCFAPKMGGVTANLGYDTKGKNIRGGLGFKLSF